MINSNNFSLVEISKIEEMLSFLEDNLSASNNSPNILELITLAENRKDKIILLALKNNDKIVAVSIFERSVRQLSGFCYNTLFLYAYDFFDYNPVYIKSGFEKQYIDFVKNYASENKIDLVLLENIELKINSGKKISQKINLFSSSISDNGFDFIINKKSLKRHKKHIINKNYSVQHYQSEDITDELIKEISDLHKERWEFDNINSAFNNEQRKINYLSNTSNKLLTIIKINNEVLAIHYGMIYKDTLIWHTPVLNIKFLEHSPFEVLLLETANYCKENKIRILDFGLGDEMYKGRFSNDNKLIFNYLFLINFLSNIKFQVSVLFKYFKFNFFISLLKDAYHYLIVLFNSVNIYKIIFTDFEDNLIRKPNIKFFVIEKYSDLVDHFRSIEMRIQRHHYSRLSKGNVFYCLMMNNNMISFGWSTCENIDVSEVEKTLDVKKTPILFDFFTPNDFRKKGYYVLILHHIISHIKSDCYIYTLKSNTGSNKAIQKVGFSISKDYTLI